MKKLSDYKGEEALELLANLIDPLSKIISDPVVADMVRSKANYMGVIKYILTNHGGALIEILALIEGEDPETYKPSVLEIPIKVLTLCNDPEFVLLFTQLGQQMED